jgi:hypothetical protein
MISQRTRIAYVRRMLKRLEPEEMRIQKLVESGDLSEKGRDMALQLTRDYRAKLKAELEALEKQTNMNR